MAELPESPSRWRRPAAWRRLALIAAALTVLVVSALGLHTIARHQGWLSERMTPQQLSEFLEPHIRVARPAGDGPFPAALLFSGCDGPMDNLDRWSEALVEAGYVAVIVDSHTPRNLRGYQEWRLVCLGQVLPGTERSGDVLVSMAFAAELPFVDGERMTLIGMSHGGWSIMDLLTRDLGAELPVNLRRLPASLASDPLGGIEAVVLAYPWCGLASRARHFRWMSDAPVLFLLARFDVIAPSYECELIAHSLHEDGRHVETMVFRNATHGFDQEHRSSLSPLRFDAEATEAAIARAIAFMNAAGSTR